tara:strand:- start:282 stop:560 length:279 start_codon:yes stop_codon:yes gene_type:complete
LSVIALNVIAPALKSSEQVEESVSDLKALALKFHDLAKNKAINLRFSADEASTRFVLEAKVSRTGEVILGDAVLSTSASLEALKGVLFDDVC